MNSRLLTLFAGLVVASVLTGAAHSSPVAAATRSINAPVIGNGIYALVADRRYHRLKPGCRAAFCRPGYNFGRYDRWKRRRDFGRAVIGTVIIGAIIATAANTVPPRPSADLCWVWTDGSRTRGYWNYCY